MNDDWLNTQTPAACRRGQYNEDHRSICFPNPGGSSIFKLTTYGYKLRLSGEALAATDKRPAWTIILSMPTVLLNSRLRRHGMHQYWQISILLLVLSSVPLPRPSSLCDRSRPMSLPTTGMRTSIIPAFFYFCSATSIAAAGVRRAAAAVAAASAARAGGAAAAATGAAAAAAEGAGAAAAVAVGNNGQRL